jgi:hypothetical protein
VFIHGRCRCARVRVDLQTTRAREIATGAEETIADDCRRCNSIRYDTIRSSSRRVNMSDASPTELTDTRVDGDTRTRTHTCPQRIPVVMVLVRPSLLASSDRTVRDQSHVNSGRWYARVHIALLRCVPFSLCTRADERSGCAAWYSCLDAKLQLTARVPSTGGRWTGRRTATVDESQSTVAYAWARLHLIRHDTRGWRRRGCG